MNARKPSPGSPDPIAPVAQPLGGAVAGDASAPVVTGSGAAPGTPAPATDTTGTPGTAGSSTWSMASILVAAGVIAFCLAMGLSALVPARTEIPGLPSAGQLTAVGLPAVKAVFDLAAAATVGWLLAAAFLVPPQRNGVLDVGGYRAVRAASTAAFVWTAAALALIPLTLSDTMGRPLDVAMSPEWILRGLSVLGSLRAFLIVAVVAALVAVLARIVLTPGWTAVLLAGSLAAMVALADTGHSSQSGDHDVAVDSMIYHLVGVTIWIGGLLAVLGLVRQRIRYLDIVTRRYSAIALVAFVVVALSGIGNAWVRIAYVSDLWTTPYGRLVLAKLCLLVVLGAAGWWHRRRTLPGVVAGGHGSFVRWATGEVLVMAVTIGVAATLGRTATPPPSGAAPSDVALILGYDLDGPPTFWGLLTQWRFDWLLGTAAIVAAGLYLVGVRRLSRRGDRWPVGRTVSWLLGCLTLLVATSSGLGRYSAAQFSIHMIEHMGIGMVVPILLVLGGPVSLALRALPAAGSGQPPGLREGIVSALHCRFSRFITHPLVVFALFVGSFYALYFSTLFGDLMAAHLGHLFMKVHFLIVGYLYYWVIIGVDPTPRRVPPYAKLALLIGALPFHAFFGLALMNGRTALAADYYTGLGLPWVTDLVGDQHTGGAIAWGATEIPLLIVLIALVAQWARSDQREADRTDRQADRDSDAQLTAYNRMLAELAYRDAGGPNPRVDR